MKEILAKEYFNNTVQEYIIAVGIILIAGILVRLIKKLILRKLDKDTNENNKRRNEFISATIKKLLIPVLTLGSVYIAIETLHFSEKISKVVNIGFSVIATYYVIRFIIVAVDYSLKKYMEKFQNEDQQRTIKPITAFLNFFIWILGIIFLLDNLGFEISSIVAGLGIGGIAVALAAQGILGDLFSYFVIFFDKPFQLGDFINFDDKFGTVEKIGIKTTKIRTLGGEILVVSNSNLTSSRVHNYKKMERRRVVFTIGVVYQTSYEKVKRIPGIIKSIIEEDEKAVFDRSHFKSYGNFSLDFESVYYVLGNDYILFMDVQQKINLRIYEEFNKEGIEFAYPTQTLYLNKEDRTINSEVVE
ncbi:MAG: mechanosensitive ion channel [Melioribacteraceae bacterium]|nr:mechanosensitive ion channel [Melioribacteraceae bacterium]MCF8354974.1 mechanosensitive ion channel [Melioribacteraceae bacterium]MCF8394009.1 mechanosensitive ion channel [Melioribacteraceae bacterium]MCF8419788.1 mechanosensitive ion channel [Melioribacteraceae bacterium]